MCTLGTAFLKGGLSDFKPVFEALILSQLNPTTEASRDNPSPPIDLYMPLAVSLIFY